MSEEQGPTEAHDKAPSLGRKTYRLAAGGARVSVGVVDVFLLVRPIPDLLSVLWSVRRALVHLSWNLHLCAMELVFEFENGTGEIEDDPSLYDLQLPLVI